MKLLIFYWKFQWNQFEFKSTFCKICFYPSFVLPYSFSFKNILCGKCFYEETINLESGCCDIYSNICLINPQCLWVFQTRGNWSFFRENYLFRNYNFLLIRTDTRTFTYSLVCVFLHNRFYKSAFIKPNVTSRNSWKMLMSLVIR